MPAGMTPEASPASGRATLKARLQGSGFFASAAKLATGAGIAQLIGMATAPLLTRIYGAANLGLYATFMGVAGSLASVASLRYEQALMLPEERREADALWTLAGGILLIASLLCIPGLFFSLRKGWMGALADLGGWLWLLPVLCGITALGAMAAVWANRMRCYNLLSISRGGNALTVALISVGLGWCFGATTGWMILANLAGQAVLVTVLWGGTARRGMGPHAVMKRESVKAMARQYRQFPFFNLPITAVDQVTGALPILVFTSQFGKGWAGILSIAFQTLRLPLVFVGSAVAQVFYERSSRLKNDPAALRSLTLRTCTVLGSVALVPVLVLVPFGPQLFGWVFGHGFTASGELARLLAVSTGLTLIVSPISMLPSVLGRQHQHLWFSLLSTILRVVSLWIGSSLRSPVATIACFVVAESLGILVFAGWVYRLIKAPPTRIQ